MPRNRHRRSAPQQEYERQLNLSKQQVTTQTAVDSAKATLDQANATILNAQASLDLAKINLGYTKVLAPFDGTVTDHLVDVGALVGVSGPTTLATSSRRIRSMSISASANHRC